MCKEASTLHGKNLTVCDTRENRVNKPGSSWIKSNARAWDTVSERFETTSPFRTCGKETTNSSSRLANRSQRLMLAWTDWWGRTAWLQTREGAWRWFRWDGGVIPTSVFGSQRNPEPEMCKRYTHTHTSLRPRSHEVSSLRPQAREQTASQVILTSVEKNIFIVQWTLSRQNQHLSKQNKTRHIVFVLLLLVLLSRITQKQYNFH